MCTLKVGLFLGNEAILAGALPVLLLLRYIYVVKLNNSKLTTASVITD